MKYKCLIYYCDKMDGICCNYCPRLNICRKLDKCQNHPKLCKCAKIEPEDNDEERLHP